MSRTATDFNRRIILTILAGVCIFFCFVGIYKLSFEKKFQYRKIVNEVVTMNIDSQKIDTLLFNQINYEYFVGGKYKISVYYDIQEPFESMGTHKIYIQNKNGDFVYCHDTKFTHFNGWQKDYIKLMNFLKIQTIN